MLAKCLSCFCCCRLTLASPKSPSAAICRLSPLPLLPMLASPLLPLLLLLSVLPLVTSSPVSTLRAATLCQLACVWGLVAPSAHCRLPRVTCACTAAMAVSCQVVLVSNSHCVPTSHVVVTSGCPLVSCKSNMSSSSYRASASAVRASVGRCSVRLMASAAEFFLPARWHTLSLNWLNCMLARANLCGGFSST